MVKDEICPKCGHIMNVRGWCAFCGYTPKKVATKFVFKEIGEEW